MSSKLSKLGCLLLSSLLGASVASAQNPPGYVPGGAQAVPYYGGYGGYGWGYNDWGAGSTPAGSYLTGMANAIRAEGEYNLNSSAAAINLEEAQKRAIENRTRWTNAYFEMRRINEAYTHPKKAPTSPETWARLAHDAAPDRLSSSVLDTVTGDIIWPSALQGNEFKPNRETLQTLFAERATMHGAIGVEGFANIRRSVEDAMAKLKSRIRQVDTGNYLEARNFLNSLAHEANFPAASTRNHFAAATRVR